MVALSGIRPQRGARVPGYAPVAMDLRRLRYFVALAEELHFTRAAQRLHIAQPALSQAVRQLERETGVDLFLRTRRHVELTPAGSVLFEDARKILSDVDAAVARARAAQQGRVGILRIGFSDGAAPWLLPTLLRAFARTYADVEVVLHPLTNATVVAEAVRSGNVDIGLTGILQASTLGARVSFMLMERQPLVVGMAADHPLSAEDVIDLRTLGPANVVLPVRAANPAFHDASVELWRDAGVAINVVAHASTMHTLLGFVAGGVGIAIVPTGTGRWNVEGAVLCPTVQELPFVSFGVVWSDEREDPIVQSLLDTAHELLVTGSLGPGTPEDASAA